MPRNPLEDVARGLKFLGERLSQTTGADPTDWLGDQLEAFRKPEPPKTLAELQAELDELVAAARELLATPHDENGGP